jgi:hypothetical protein
LTHPLIQQSVEADADIGDLISPTTQEVEKGVTWADWQHAQPTHGFIWHSLTRLYADRVTEFMKRRPR